MVYFAYDGSIDGDWVSRYAIQMAAHSSPAALHLVHVQEPGNTAIPAEKIRRIEYECKLRHVELTISEKPLQHDLFSTLISLLDPQSLVICGMRRRDHRANRLGHLKNSIARLLLEHQAFDVLAVRVLHPGLLGAPHRILLPLHASLPLPQGGLAFLRLLAHGLRRVHLMEFITTGRIPYLPAWSGWILQQRRAAEARLKTQETELAKALGIASACFDSSIRLTHAWPHEVILRAGRHKAQLIFMGLPKQGLLQRLNGNYPVEEVLRDAPCDVAIFGGKQQ
jgi:nucleotide-binding universal stress UspA family protein